jgi:hypothetical protein
MKLTLRILLSGDHFQDADEEIIFPDERSMLLSCSAADDDDTVNGVDVEINEEPKEVPLNEPCAVVWDAPLGRNWYIGMAREKVDENYYIVEYLECVSPDSTRRSWKYPKKEDEQKTNIFQEPSTLQGMICTMFVFCSSAFLGYFHERLVESGLTHSRYSTM